MPKHVKNERTIIMSWTQAIYKPKHSLLCTQNKTCVYMYIGNGVQTWFEHANWPPNYLQMITLSQETTRFCHWFAEAPLIDACGETVLSTSWRCMIDNYQHPSLNHHSIIKPPSAHHQPTIDAPSVHHPLTIKSHSVHHQRSPSAHHQPTINSPGSNNGELIVHN